MNNEYGRLMLDLNGKSLSNEDKTLISNKHVGGLIFFSRNFESFDQIKSLGDEIRSIKDNIIRTIDTYEPRVSVERCLVEPNFDANGFDVRLDFLVLSRADIPAISIEFFLNRSQ